MDNILSEFVYGSTDGIITTFSIIAGSIGGDLPTYVILILGLSNVLSDGYSMGVSRYLSAKTEIQQGLLKNKNAFISAIATFISFILVGIIPLIPFMYNVEKRDINVEKRDINSEKEEQLVKDNVYSKKKLSLILAIISFFLIGVIKGYYLETSSRLKSVKEKILWNGIESLVIGGSAAYISYMIGKVVNNYITQEK